MLTADWVLACFARSSPVSRDILLRLSRWSMRRHYEAPSVMSIQQLPQDVVDGITASMRFTSVNDVICGLLKNALDAGATKIKVHVDHVRGNCRVEDNGVGIPPAEFRQDGGLGKLQRKFEASQTQSSHVPSELTALAHTDTSKFPPTAGCHGRRGDFLASLGKLSLLSVTSRHQNCLSQNTLSIHNGRLLARHIPSPPEQRFETFEHGTRVAVCDLFGSMPVRVKHRAALATNVANLERQWERLSRDVISLLLPWNSGISVFLKDDVTQSFIRLKPPPQTDIVSRTSRLFLQGSLSDSTELGSWVPVSASAGPMFVSGCVSLSPAPTRRGQFLSLDMQPIDDEYGTNVLYEEINWVFSQSSFGVMELATEEGILEEERSTLPRAVKARKGLERWPRFYLRIDTSASIEVPSVINSLLSWQQRDWENVLDLLRAVCYGFLKKHNFRLLETSMTSRKFGVSTAQTARRASRLSSRHSSRAQDAPSGSPSHDRLRIVSSRPGGPFDDWYRVKAGLPSRRPRDSCDDVVERRTARELPRRLIGEGGKLLRKPLDEPRPKPDAKSASNVGKGEPCSVPEGLASGAPKERAGDLSSSWLQEVVHRWENPVFESTQTATPRIHAETPSRPHGVPVSHMCHTEVGEDINFPSASLALDGRIERASLADAEVVSQVDCKFVLLKMLLSGEARESSGLALVMLDQHASDERCRLEDLMGQYFQRTPANILMAVSEILLQPLIFEVSAREAKLLAVSQGHFSYWGILYEMQQPLAQRADSQNGSSTLKVTALPPSILGRCSSEPHLLIDLVREELSKLAEEIKPQTQPRQVQADTSWAVAFHHCPRGILQLLYSRSCRSMAAWSFDWSALIVAKLMTQARSCSMTFCRSQNARIW